MRPERVLRIRTFRQALVLPQGVASGVHVALV